MTFPFPSFNPGFSDPEDINTSCASGGEINITGLDLSIYADVRLYLDGITVNADDNAVQMQVEIGGSVISTGYRYVLRNIASSGSTDNTSSTSSTMAPLTLTVANFGLGNDTGECLSGVIYIHNFNEARNKLFNLHTTRTGPTGVTIYSVGHGQVQNTGLITGFRFFCPDVGGEISSGCVYVVGIPIP